MTPYNPAIAKVGDPVPLARQAETLAWALKHWWPTWNYESRTNEKDAEKHVDFDVALAAAMRTVGIIADLAKILGDERVLNWLQETLAKQQAKAAAERGGA